MALTKITGQVVDTATDLVVGVTTVGGGLSATDGFFSGIVTAVGDASFSGNVSVGGTLTYEDVTNIDAVGLVTARNGIVVGSGITLSKDGDIFATGITTISENLKVGTGVTISPDGDGFFTGVVTATTFKGDGSQLSNVTSTTINNNADNRLITGSGTANTLEGEATLTYNGTDTFELQPASATPAIFVGDSNRTGAGQGLAQYRGNWNGTTVARMTFDAGDDTTNKDDGIIRFDTAPSGSLSERFRIGSAGQLGIAGANYGTSGQVLQSQGSSSAPQWATPSTPITTSVNAGPLSGATNYDFTLPSNCYKVEFVGHNISTSGSGTPSFRAGTSGGILSSGQYTFTDSAWHSSRNQIDFADENMNGGGDTGDFIVSFYSSSSSDMWIFEGKAVRRTQGSIIHVLGMLDLGGAALTTLRFYPEGTGFDTGRIRWTGYSY